LARIARVTRFLGLFPISGEIENGIIRSAEKVKGVVYFLPKATNSVIPDCAGLRI
jgi:hypothetical protein